MSTICWYKRVSFFINEFWILNECWIHRENMLLKLCIQTISLMKIFYTKKKRKHAKCVYLSNKLNYTQLIYQHIDLVGVKFRAEMSGRKHVSNKYIEYLNLKLVFMTLKRSSAYCKLYFALILNSNSMTFWHSIIYCLNIFMKIEFLSKFYITMWNAKFIVVYMYCIWERGKKRDENLKYSLVNVISNSIILWNLCRMSQ